VIGDTTFLILRAHDVEAPKDADSVQELTRKIAIFTGKGFVLTIHRKDLPFLALVRTDWQTKIKDMAEAAGDELLATLLYDCFQTFEPALNAMAHALEVSETAVFGTHANQQFDLEQGYYLRRGVSVAKRLLRQSFDVATKLSHHIDGKAAPHFQDVRERVESLLFHADELYESTHTLLSLHLALASQKTNEASHRINEIIRVLTIFSVFFLPLNFITGIYGMNFEVMPGIHLSNGFTMVTMTMLLVTTSIALWFRHKGWMKT
jgi:magnesium transporter